MGEVMLTRPAAWAGIGSGCCCTHFAKGISMYQ